MEISKLRNVFNFVPACHLSCHKKKFHIPSVPYYPIPPIISTEVVTTTQGQVISLIKKKSQGLVQKSYNDIREIRVTYKSHL